MYEISVRGHFSAAHRLRDYPGSCASLHGHNWEVTVLIRGDRLDALGMLVDFRDVKKAVRETLAELDHVDLNTLAAFRRRNPTSENLARHIHEGMSRRLHGSRYAVDSIRVAETADSAVTYRPAAPRRKKRDRRAGKRA